jgi:hypothetical protein
MNFVTSLLLLLLRLRRRHLQQENHVLVYRVLTLLLMISFSLQLLEKN